MEDQTSLCLSPSIHRADNAGADRARVSTQQHALCRRLPGGVRCVPIAESGDSGLGGGFGEVRESVALVEGDDCLPHTLGVCVRVGVCVSVCVCARARSSLSLWTKVQGDDF